MSQSTETKEPKEYSFDAGTDNVYGEYLKTTFIRQNVVPYFLLAFFSLLFVVVALYIVLHPADFWLDGFTERFGDRVIPRYVSLVAIPLSVLVLILGSFLIVFIGFPLLPHGCSLGNYVWPRFYSWSCEKNEDIRFKRIQASYFSSFERHAMRAVVREKSVRVTESDGKARTFALRNARRAYRSKRLVVLESGPKECPTSEVILDISGMGTAKRREFCRFLDARLPTECKCYYVRLAEPQKAMGRTGIQEQAGATDKKDSRKIARMDNLKDELLPLGSVVRLDDRPGFDFMIYGWIPPRAHHPIDSYLVVLFPDGYRPDEADEAFMVSRSEVSEVMFMGYHGRDAERFQEYLEGSHGVWDASIEEDD